MLDVSRVGFDDEFLARMPASVAAPSSMATLEAGRPANPNELRMVGHHWLRAPERAPTRELQALTTEAIGSVRVNVHHQPGVEKAAVAPVLTLEGQVVAEVARALAPFTLRSSDPPRCGGPRGRCSYSLEAGPMSEAELADG